MKKQGMRSGQLAHAAFCLAMMLFCWTGPAQAGSLDPTNPPGPTMYTLEEIYQQLEVMDAKIPAAEQLQYGDAEAGGIRENKTALVQGESVTGTMETRTLSAANDTVTTGYYEATTLSAVDTDLTAANIAVGKTIFGVIGTAAGVGAYAAPVAKTGQTVSYRSRDDGDLEKGVTWPIPRYTDNADQTVTDNLTGLMWTKNANIWGTNVWGMAIDKCESYSLAGHDDWRLPNVHELYSLIDKGRSGPALPTGHPFTGVQLGHYWSATPRSAGYAWFVELNTGYTMGEGSTTAAMYFVWPVRGGL